MTGAASALLERPDVRSLLAAFAAAGVEARIVGGAVRDAVMGRPPGDIDIASPMHPRAVMALAERRGWKAIPTGIEHGTVTLVLAGRAYEATTLRRDVATDGRRAVVAFTDDWREDAFRRDFTLNALSLSADGVVHDYAAGVADARAGLIRFMGEPERRIREDYLRILRFFRFLASHGAGAPEPEGLAACAELKSGLAGISRERVRQELMKLLVAPGAPEAAVAMELIRLWPLVLPGVSVDVQALARWTSLRDAIPDAGDPMSGLFALLGADDSASRAASSLRLSRDEAARLALFAVHAASLSRALDDPALLREAVYRTGPAAFPAALRATAARRGVSVADAARAADAAQPLLATPPRNPFASREAAALGIPAGPRMGRVMKAAEAAWIAAGLPESPDAARRILKEAADRN
jgi:poly(A) polymerase